MKDRTPIALAHQQFLTAVLSDGYAAREVKEYLRVAWGFGTVSEPDRISTQKRVEMAINEANEARPDETHTET